MCFLMQFETSWRVVSRHLLNTQRDLVEFRWSFTQDHGDGTNGRWRSPNPPRPSPGQEVESAFKRGAGAVDSVSGPDTAGFGSMLVLRAHLIASVPDCSQAINQFSDDRTRHCRMCPSV